jgi:ATP phosphoribosyltransferase
MTWREEARELRIATKYPRLTQQFLFSQGLFYFTMVESSGAMEAAPTMGYADLIADLTSSGTTLRENQLKTIGGGSILKSQACLVANLGLLGENPTKVKTTETILELMEARQRATGYFSVTANIQGSSPEAVARHVMSKPEVAGIQGPTVAKVYSKLSEVQDWYAVTVVVPTDMVLRAVQHLREIGGSGITAFSAKYVFEGASRYFQRLKAALGERKTL